MNKLRLTTPDQSIGDRSSVSEHVGRLWVGVYATRGQLGRAAARAVAARLRKLLTVQPTIRVAFAAAPSQNELLAALAEATRVDWSRIEAFQLDEYVGVGPGATGLFREYLADRILDRVCPGRVELVDSSADPDTESRRYAAAIAEAPLDVALLGIGENGHLAFNDPPSARFDDPLAARVVTLSEESRRQQVADGCFPTLGDVPERAITLTLPTLFASRHVFCVAPGRRKRQAVTRTLRGPIDESCPASILRRHPSARLYVDVDSFEAAPAG